MSISLDDMLTEEVLGPWQEACRRVFYPWMATQNLRNKWMGMMESDDPATAFCGAIGIARCADLSSAERRGIEKYFSGELEVPIPPHVLLAILLTGASPPANYVAGFASYQLQTVPARNETGAKVWTMLSNIIRHPSVPDILASPSRIEGITADCFEYLRYAHPCLDCTFFPPHKNPWIRALQIFKAKHRGDVPADMLQRFAYFMRVDFSREEFTRLTFASQNNLPDPFFGVQLQHPVLRRGACPSFSHTNPHREAIDYFSTDEPVCHAWRYHNPLLNYPWVFEMVNDAGQSELFACLGLLGGLMIGANNHPAFDCPAFRGVLPDHPAFAVSLAYLGVTL